MTNHGQALDRYYRIRVALEDTTGDVTLLYERDSECALDAEQALELLRFLLAHEDDIKRGQKKAQKAEHAESFWYVDTFTLSSECDCPVCRYILCDDGDEAFAQNFPGVSHGLFDQRMIALDLHYGC